MNEKNFVPEKWQNLENKQDSERQELASKHTSEKSALVEEDHKEAIEMNVQFEDAKAKLEEITGKKIEIPQDKKEQAELFKVWRVIELGTGLKTAEDFEKALKKAGREVSDYARKFLKDVEKEIASANKYEKREIELVDATSAELGLPKGGTLEQIYEAAEKMGLEKCPREAGPQSAIQYEDQPNGEYRLIGMEPVGSDGNRHVFDVGRLGVGRRWLSSRYDCPGDVWPAGSRFVFARRKKSELNS